MPIHGISRHRRSKRDTSGKPLDFVANH
jgi:hypothetical protein